MSEKKNRSVRLSDRTWEMLNQLKAEFPEYGFSVEHIFFKSLKLFERSLHEERRRHELYQAEMQRRGACDDE